MQCRDFTAGRRGDIIIPTRPMSRCKEMSKVIPAKKVIVINPKEVKLGGTIDYAVEKSQETGTVVAIGKGKSPVEGLKVGDLVAYRQFGESKLYIEGTEYLFVVFDDILGKIK